MNLRLVRDDQRGGSTIEWLGMCVVVALLILALILAVPVLGARVRDAIEYLICLVVSPVTGQACPAPEPPDVPGGEPGEPGEPVVPPAALPGLDECIPYWEEQYYQGTIEGLVPIPQAPAVGIGGHLAGRYWMFKYQRADGKWEVTPIWYGDASALVGHFPTNGFGGLYGMDGQTWIVDTEAEADAILRGQLFRPWSHIPGAQWWGSLFPPLRGLDLGLQALGIVEGGYGPPQREFAGGGTTIGGEADISLSRYLGRRLSGYLGAGLTGNGQIWYGPRETVDLEAGELTHAVWIKGDARGSASLNLPLLGGRVSPAVGGFLQGELAVTVGLVQDMETGEFTHVDVRYNLLDTHGAGPGGGAGDRRDPRGQGGGGGSARFQVGDRTLVHGRLPLEGLSPEDRADAVEWVQALLEAGDSEEIDAALAQQDLGALFDSMGDAVITSQHYQVDGTRIEADFQLGPPMAGVAVDPRIDTRHHTLDDATFWVDGVGWVDWTECHG